jgi:type IV secretion system protein VirB4
MYRLAPEIRRLSSLTLPPRLQPYLAKWIAGGMYGNVFDTIDEGITLSRVQSFDFRDVSQNHKDLLEPLLYWISRRCYAVIHDPANLDTPKHIVFDEVFLLIENPQILRMLLTTAKTGRKDLCGVTLAAQTVLDLGKHLDVILAACPQMLLLRDPSFDEEFYEERLKLNRTEITTFASLQERESLLKWATGSKVLQLNVDAESTWRFSTRAKDRARRAEAIAIHGREQAYKVLTAAAGG